MHSIFQTINNALKPVHVLDKIRLGRNQDGGYVFSHAVATKCEILISLGINDEWSFEEDFIRTFKTPAIIMIDDQSSERTIYLQLIKTAIVRLYRPLNKNVRQSLISLNKLHRSFQKLKNYSKVQYIKRKIGNGANDLSLSTLFTLFKIPKNKQNVILKIDIEGYEYEIINQLLSHASHFSGLIIEFHNILKSAETFFNAIELLKSHFHIIHVHFNNYTLRNEYISDAVEVSFVHHALINDPIVDSATYPILGLDFPCNPEKQDYMINISHK